MENIIIEQRYVLIRHSDSSRFEAVVQGNNVGRKYNGIRALTDFVQQNSGSFVFRYENGIQNMIFDEIGRRSKLTKIK